MRPKPTLRRRDFMPIVAVSQRLSVIGDGLMYSPAGKVGTLVSAHLYAPSRSAKTTAKTPHILKRYKDLRVATPQHLPNHVDPQLSSPAAHVACSEVPSCNDCCKDGPFLPLPSTGLTGKRRPERQGCLLPQSESCPSHKNCPERPQPWPKAPGPSLALSTRGLEHEHARDFPESIPTR